MYLALRWKVDFFVPENDIENHIYLFYNVARHPFTKQLFSWKILPVFWKGKKLQKEEIVFVLEDAFPYFLV